jgi:formamidopyrimidine-DNA glycosylase
VPELPEVQRVVDTLAPAVEHALISRVELVRPDIVEPPGFDLASRLVGHSIASVTRRGKRIMVCLDTGDRWFIHLGMTGRLTVEPADNPRRPHTHLLLDLDEGSRQIRFVDPRRFGGVRWQGPSTSSDLGPEPLTMRPQTLARRLRRTKRAVKSALLDQQLVAGLGNIYVDESLFAAGIDPRRRGCDLSPAEIARLSGSIKRILRRAIRAGGSTLRDYVDANGQAGAFQTLHRVYGREGQPCRKCKTPIERFVVGGRSTHVCPKCQE